MIETVVRARCDRKGRLYLRESLRSKYGDSFIVLALKDEIILLPIPKDPVKDLQRLGKKLKGISIEEIKRRIRERAYEEVLE